MRRPVVLLAIMVASFPATSLAQPADPSAEDVTVDPGSESAEDATDAVCLPSCRPGFVCVSGTCVSACNPPCAAHESCTEALECVPSSAPPGPSSAEPEIARPVSSAAPRPTPRRGPSIAAGLQFGWAMVGYPNVDFDSDLPGRPFVRGNAVAIGAAFNFDYGLTDRFFLGVHLGLARFVNSDNDSSIGLQFAIGPSLTAFLTRHFYVGLDALLNYMSFDGVGGSVHMSSPTDARIFQESVDVDSSVGLTLALRLGVALEISERFAITPEVRLWGQPATFSLDGAYASYRYERPGVSGAGYAFAHPENGFFAGAALFVGTRHYF